MAYVQKFVSRMLLEKVQFYIVVCRTNEIFVDKKTA